MTTMGSFTAKGGEYTGTIATLTIRATIRIVPVQRMTDAEPSHRVFAGDTEVRAAYFVFHKRGVAEIVGDTGRLARGFGPPGEPPRVTGLDSILVREDRIAALYLFLDPSSP